MGRILTTGALLLGLAACQGAPDPRGAEPPGTLSSRDIPPEMQGVQAKQLFGAKQQASQQRANVHGGYSDGCLAGAAALPETGATWQAMRLSRTARENLSAISMRRANGAYTNDNWTRAQHEIVKAAAQDPRTARIFIFPGAKVRMCNEETGDRDWLRKVRPWWGHHYHFHVRLNCPDGATGCVPQTAPPPGDGCAEAEQWVRNILNPPPPDPDAPSPKPRRELTMEDLPRQCLAVLQSD